MPRSGAEDGDREHALGRLAGARVDDVRAALVGARGGDREISRAQDGGGAVAQVRVLDADAPRQAGRALAPHAHVAAGVDAQVARAGADEHRRRALDGPTLHEGRRVDDTAGADVEAAAGARPQGLAAREHGPDLGRGVAERERAGVQAADLAVGAVGAERRVDPAQPVEGTVERAGIDLVVAHVDADGHAHDDLDAVQPVSHATVPDRSRPGATCGSCGSCRSPR